MGILIDSLTNNYSEPSQYDEILDKILDSMQKRIDYSFANRHIDVYCQSGLLKLAKEGRLTDHLDGMPAFDQIEKRMIFEYIRDRNADPADSYTLYITRDTIFENNYVISVFKGLGILIEYTLEKSQKGMFSSLMVENEMIAETFADYVENHVPHVHAMSKDETMSFLDELIEMCQ